MNDTVDLRLGPALVVPVAAAPFTGWIEVSGGRITHAGPIPTIARARETAALRGRVVIPALVNTHCHTSQQLGRGLAADLDPVTGLRRRIWPYEVALDERDSEVSALACAIEQIRNGCTLLADPGGRHVDGMARGLAAAGVRALLGRSTMDEGEDRPGVDRESTEEALALQDDLAARWHGVGRLRFSYTLRSLCNCSDELITETLARARRLGTVVQMHVAETPEENAHARRTRGASTVRHLDKLNALGPDLLAVHAVHVDDEEIGLLAERRCPVSHTATADLKVFGTPRLDAMLDRGVLVGLGTDGAPVNGRMSMIDEMWLTSLTRRVAHRGATAPTAHRVLRMATLDGARALGMDRLVGSIEVGKRADLVVLDPRGAGVTAAADPVSALVAALTPEHVESVLCDGEWLLRNRRITRVDEAEVLAEAARRATAVRHRAGL